VPNGTSGTTRRFGGVSGGDAGGGEDSEIVGGGEDSETVGGVCPSSKRPMMMATIRAERDNRRIFFLFLKLGSFITKILRLIDKG